MESTDRTGLMDYGVVAGLLEEMATMADSPEGLHGGGAILLAAATALSEQDKRPDIRQSGVPTIS